MTSDQIVVVTYHCLGCGEIISQEEDVPAPSCCGKPMTKAVEEKIDAAEVSSETTPDDNRVPPKPR
jgi:hypothetical protein